jgi:SAM-dependent methyltransferase
MPGYGPKKPAAPAAPKLDPTPQAVVEEILDLLQPKPDETLYDLGCGDGRVVITAAEKYGCKAVGIEINQQRAQDTFRKVRDAGLDDKVKIYHGDARSADIADADIIFMYLFPETMDEIGPRIFVADRIATYSHPLGDVPVQQVDVELDDGSVHPVYLWNQDQYDGLYPPEKFRAETAVPPASAPDPPQAAPTGQTRTTRPITATRTRPRLFPRLRRSK